MKRLTSALVVVCTLTMGPVSAREFSNSSPERQGFSSERLDRLTEFMDAKVEDGTMVGGMGLIARNGKIVYRKLVKLVRLYIFNPAKAQHMSFQ